MFHHLGASRKTWNGRLCGGLISPPNSALIQCITPSVRIAYGHDIRYVSITTCYVSLRTTLIYSRVSASRFSPKHRRERAVYCTLYSTWYLFFQLSVFNFFFLLLAPVSRVSLQGACQPRLGCLSPRSGILSTSFGCLGPCPCHLVRKELPLAHCSGA